MKIPDRMSAITKRRTVEQMSSAAKPLCDLFLGWSIAPDSKHQIRNVGTDIYRLLGCHKSEPAISLCQIARQIDAPHRKAALGLIRDLNRGPHRSVLDIEVTTADGASHWLRVAGKSNPITGGGLQCDVVAIDITDQYQMLSQAELARAKLNDQVIELQRTKTQLEGQAHSLIETTQKLTEARRQVEEASRGKSNFLSYMSHELRTPLNAIIGFSEVISQESFGPIGQPKYKDYAGDILIAGRHLLSLINDVLDYSKVESGKDELFEETFPVADTISGVVRMLRERISQQSLVIETTLPGDEICLHADERKLKQILINLLTNAIKYTEPGGRISLATRLPADGGLTLTVSDEGIGIAPEDIPKALGMFGQIRNSFSTHKEGTGLGLPLSRSLVELHGGTFDIESEPGVGTTVTIHLPSERIVSRSPSPQIQIAGA